MRRFLLPVLTLPDKGGESQQATGRFGVAATIEDSLTAQSTGQRAGTTQAFSQAYRLITQDERGIPIPYYAMQHWTVIQNGAEFLTEIAFRQAGWVSQTRSRSIEVELHLADLTRWCNLSSQHLDQIIAQGKYIHWFARKKTVRSNRKGCDLWEIDRGFPIAPHHLWAIDQYVKQTLPDWLILHEGDLTTYLDDLQERVFWILSRVSITQASLWEGEKSSIQEIIEAAAGARISNDAAQKCAAIHSSILHVSHKGPDRARNSFWCTHYFLERCLPRLGSQMAVAVMRLRFLKESGQIQTPLLISDSKRGYTRLGELMGIDFRTARKWVTGLTRASSGEKCDLKIEALRAFISSLPAGRDGFLVNIYMDDPLWGDEADLLLTVNEMLEQGREEQDVARYVAAYRKDQAAGDPDANKHSSETNTFVRILEPESDVLQSNDFHESINKSFHESGAQPGLDEPINIPFHEKDKDFHEDGTKTFVKPDKDFHEVPVLINQEVLKLRI